MGNGANARVGATLRDAAVAIILTGSGTQAGTLDIHGDTFGSPTSGYFTATDGGRYVRIYDSGGAQTLYFGDQAGNNDPNPTGGPLHFYQLGGAVRTPDGQYLVTDTQKGVMLFSAQGLLLGAVPPTEIDPLGLTQQSNIVVIGNYVYLTTGSRFTANQYLVRLPLAQLVARALSAPVATSLGIGAGFVTGVQDNYYTATQPVVVDATFDPWWQSVAADYSLCWSVRDRDQVINGDPGFGGSLAGSSWQFGSRGIALPIPQNLPPGAYQVSGSLVSHGAAVAATQMIFTVGAAGQSLSMTSLPAGADWGGPGPLRDVVLASELGTKTVREQLDWNKLLDNGATAPLDFSSYDAAYAAASAKARQLGVTFIVQLGQGGPERSLVNNGTWQQRVREVVEHFKGELNVWEAWNEPNATFGSGADYVAKVLAPVYRAVKSVDPQMTVVGGSVVGTSLGYWQTIVNAGGLNYMDVAADHPYSGYNRSFEEQGTIPELRALKALLVCNGKSIPLWFTELAWWSDGAANIWDQADYSSRAMLWMAALGIDKWAYFISEGGWGNDGVSFSAIQVNDYVKPAALALMTTSSQLAGRPFLGEVSLAAPSTYALRFGPRPNDPTSGQLLVAWTDGMNVSAAVTSAQPGTSVVSTDDLGRTSNLTVNGPTPLELGDGPIFLQSDRSARLNVTPTESFGPNLATQAAGAFATATSANPANPPSKAIDDDSGAAGASGLPGSPYWVSAPGDTNPSLTVTLAHPQAVDRIAVSTHSLGSVVPGLRDYTVETRSAPNAPWSTAATVQSQFYERQAILSFPARTVSAVRVTVSSVNFSGTYDDGHRPTWWPTDAASLSRASDPWYGPAVIGDVAAFAPGQTVSVPSGQTDIPTPPTTSAPPTTTRLPAPAHPRLTVTGPVSSPVGGAAHISARVTGVGVPARDLRLTLLQGNQKISSGIVGGNLTTFTVPIRRTTTFTVVLRNLAGLVVGSKRVVVLATRRTSVRLSAEARSRGGREDLTGRVKWRATPTAVVGVPVQLWAKHSGGWRLVARSVTGRGGLVRFAASTRHVTSWQLRVYGSARIDGFVALASRSPIFRAP